ncbi:RCC1 domain-containing protein [Paenibacillus mucilaginosus]|uniref:RCC1 domain-containing protein n=1 Tax=Paenibacillus mucilaginosus TaxID=61624 RepID=UPI001EE65905|nr:RCC1 domain-containing protein [Paenibacillus mucilaginosus]
MAVAADRSKTPVEAAAGGTGHSLFLQKDGTVWAWGANSTRSSGTERKPTVIPPFP